MNQIPRVVNGTHGIPGQHARLLVEVVLARDLVHVAGSTASLAKEKGRKQRYAIPMPVHQVTKLR